MAGPTLETAPQSRQMPEAMPVLICYVDAQQHYRFANAAYQQWFGVAPESLVGRQVSDFLGQEHYAAYRRHIETALSGRQVTFETEIKSRDGQPRDVQLILVPHVVGDGRTRGFYQLVTDVSAVKRSQQALLDSEAMYHSLVESLPLCILRKDPEGRFTFANSKFYEFSKETPADVIGKTDFDLFPQELAEKYRRDDRRVTETREYFEDVEQHETPAGARRYVQILKSPLYDASHRVVGTQVIFWDVTERRQAEEAVKEGAARKRAIFENALDCIIIVDQAGKIVEFNRAAERTFGYGHGELVGQDLDATLFTPAVQQRQRANLERYRATREAGSLLGRRVEIPARRKNGEVFEVEMAMQPIPMEGKTYFAVFLHDITERRQAQEEIAQKNKDLETLLYVTSHDLREPLRAIESFSKIVHDRYSQQLDDKGRDLLQRVTDGAHRLDQLLDDILMLSRAQRGGDAVFEVQASDIVRDVLDQLQAKVQATGATVTVAADLPCLRADRRWVRQALFNLVANALKFTRDGEAPHIEVDRYVPEPHERGHVGLVVRDRGPGVDLEHAERIFQLFQRAVSRKIEGTGAGLAIVRQVAERHGGQAWMRPRDGGGSEFFITFAQTPL